MNMITSQIELIRRACLHSADALRQVAEQGIETELVFDVDCSRLEDFNHIDIRQAELYREMFAALAEYDGPVVYYWDILGDTDIRQVFDAFCQYRNNPDSKATPAVKSRIDPESRCLYVGKKKRGMWGRVIQHLGFYKVAGTQGLQLFYWGKELELKLRLHVYILGEGMANYLEIVESALAAELKPIVGKHK